MDWRDLDLFAPTDEQARSWVWDRKKPVYIGEFLWIPSNDPSWNTVFLGDDAYIDYREYRDRAKAESWRMQILGYRHFEVGGMPETKVTIRFWIVAIVLALVALGDCRDPDLLRSCARVFTTAPPFICKSSNWT